MVLVYGKMDFADSSGTVLFFSPGVRPTILLRSASWIGAHHGMVGVGPGRTSSSLSLSLRILTCYHLTVILVA